MKTETVTTVTTGTLHELGQKGMNAKLAVVNLDGIHIVEEQMNSEIQVVSAVSPTSKLIETTAAILAEFAFIETADIDEIELKTMQVAFFPDLSKSKTTATTGDKTMKNANQTANPNKIATAKVPDVDTMKVQISELTAPQIETDNATAAKKEETAVDQAKAEYATTADKEQKKYEATPGRQQSQRSMRVQRVRERNVKHPKRTNAQTKNLLRKLWASPFSPKETSLDNIIHVGGMSRKTRTVAGISHIIDGGNIPYIYLHGPVGLNNFSEQMELLSIFMANAGMRIFVAPYCIDPKMPLFSLDFQFYEFKCIPRFYCTRRICPVNFQEIYSLVGQRICSGEGVILSIRNEKKDQCKHQCNHILRVVLLLREKDGLNVWIHFEAGSAIGNPVTFYIYPLPFCLKRVRPDQVIHKQKYKFNSFNSKHVLKPTLPL